MGYKKLEAKLYRYRTDKAIIERIKASLESLEPEANTSISYSERVQSSNLSNPTLAAIEVAESKEEALRQSLRAKELEIKPIEIALSALTDMEKAVVTDRYIKGLQWWQVGHNQQCSETWAKNIRKIAMEKMLEIVAE